MSDYYSGTIIDANPKKLNSYIASFRNLYGESFISGTLDTDSLITTSPLFDLTVHSKNKEITHIKVFNKKTTKNIYIDGDISIQEPERYIALINDKDWMVIQANTFLKVIKKLSNLRK